MLFAVRYRNIGLKIAYYRKKKGYTQAKLAEQIVMSAAYLGQIERGNRGNSFSLETLYQIADALEIDAELLMKDEMQLQLITYNIYGGFVNAKKC